MTGIPSDLSAAIAQAQTATQAAIAAGLTRIEVSLAFPELKVMPVAAQFLGVLADYGDRLTIFFPDAGAAALARRNWSQPETGLPFDINDVGSGRTPMTGNVRPEAECFLFIEPSDVEVLQVEELCNQIGDRPVIFLNPRLENIATIGIGYAGRQLRERFLSTIEPAYYLKPIEGAAILRAYPQPWQVWREPASDSDPYTLAAELPQRPSIETLAEIFAPTNPDGTSSAPTGGGFLSQLQQFIRALSQ